MRLKLSNEAAGMALATMGIFLFSAKAILVKVAYRYDVVPWRISESNRVQTAR